MGHFVVVILKHRPFFIEKRKERFWIIFFAERNVNFCLRTLICRYDKFLSLMVKLSNNLFS